MEIYFSYVEIAEGRRFSFPRIFLGFVIVFSVFSWVWDRRKPKVNKKKTKMSAVLALLLHMTSALLAALLALLVGLARSYGRLRRLLRHAQG